MIVNFPKDLAYYLNSNMTELTLGTNLAYNTKIKDNDKYPDKMVSIFSMLPKRSERIFCNKNEVRYVKAKIIIRSDPNDFNSAHKLSEEIWEELQTSANNIYPYEDIYWKYSGFEQNDPDEEKRYTFTCYIEGWYQRIFITYAEAKELGLTYADLASYKYKNVRRGSL